MSQLSESKMSSKTNDPVAREERKKRKLAKLKEQMRRNQEKNTTQEPKNVLHPCLPSVFYTEKFSIIQRLTSESNKFHSKWTAFRRVVLKIIESSLFESFILLIILLSSLSLTIQDANLKDDSYASGILTAFDIIFTAVFVIEMVLKWIGLGLRKYFTDAWCLLDFCIVIVSGGLLFEFFDTFDV